MLSVCLSHTIGAQILSMFPFQPVLGISNFLLHSQLFSALFRYSCGRSGAGTSTIFFVESISDSCAKKVGWNSKKKSHVGDV